MADQANPVSLHVSRSNFIIISTVVSTAVALALTILRLYVRRYIIKVLGWDDFHNVLAMVLSLVVLGLTLGAVSHGFGHHFAELDKARAAYAIELLRINEFMLIFCTVFVKIAICTLLLRIFNTDKRYTRFLWAFVIFNTVYSALDAALIFPQCTPVAFNWDKGIKGHCWSNSAINGIGIAQGSIAAVTDFTLSFLPVVFLWNVKIIWRVKLGIMGVMALGLASGAFAVVRTLLVPGLTTTTDPTYDLVDLFTYAIFEANFGVIAAALPSVRPLLGRNKTSSGYGYQISKPHTAPTHNTHNTHKPHNTNHSWVQYEPPLPSTSRRNGGDEEAGSEDGSDQVELWPYKEGGIVKTTDVHVRRSSPGPLGSGGPPRLWP